MERMSPTVHFEGRFRFYFFSREEERMHIHVKSPDGDAKYWLEPEICLARSSRMSDKDLAQIAKILEERVDEFRDHWQRHFKRGS